MASARPPAAPGCRALLQREGLHEVGSKQTCGNRRAALQPAVIMGGAKQKPHSFLTSWLRDRRRRSAQHVVSARTDGAALDQPEVQAENGRRFRVWIAAEMINNTLRCTW